MMTLIHSRCMIKCLKLWGFVEHGIWESFRCYSVYGFVVIIVTSQNHMLTKKLLLQVGLSRARRLGQGQCIKIVTGSNFPVQIDGEPWIQPPGTMEITHYGQVYNTSTQSALDEENE